MFQNDRPDEDSLGMSEVYQNLMYTSGIHQCWASWSVDLNASQAMLTYLKAL